MDSKRIKQLDINHPSQKTEQQLAQECADTIFANDTVTSHFDMQLLSVAVCFAQVQMTILPWMCNGHGTCHGGVSFTLADSAFAVACNTQNKANVAVGVSINYIAPGFVGMY
jgi:acyl-CoA thioesterase